MRIPPASFVGSIFGALLSSLALFCLAAAPARAGSVKVLQVTAVVSVNISGASVGLDDPDLNGKPALKLIVSQHYISAYNNHPVGVTYTPGTPASLGRWSIFNEDGAPMADGAGFNILIASTATKVSSDSANSIDDITGLHVASGKPAAFLYFSHMWNPYPKLLAGNFVPKNLGLNYLSAVSAASPLHDKWAIFNEDNSSVLAATYFVFDGSKLANNLVHTASVANNVLQFSRITESGAINTSTAVVFFTPLGPTMSDKTLGVSFDGAHWGIISEDGSSGIPVGQQFNVLYFPAPTP